jgi:hypothetical protein
MLETDLAEMAETQVFYLFLAAFALAPFMLRLISALVYTCVDSLWLFRGIAVGLAVLMTAATLLQRTPMLGVKVFANFAVALAFGWLIPLLTRP